MAKQKKLALAALSTAVAVSSVAVPTFVGAEGTENLSLERVVVTFEGKQYVIAPQDYTRAISGRGDQELQNIVKGGSLTGVEIGKKFIAPNEYTRVVRDGSVTADEIVNFENQDTSNAVEKDENGAWTPVTPDQTPSTPEVVVDSVEPGITLRLAAGKTPKLPTTIDALVNDVDGNTYVKVVSVEWDQESVKQITTEEGDLGEIKGTVTFQGKTYSLSYEYEVVVDAKEAKKLEALQRMENIENYELGRVDTAASNASDAASNASDEASYLSDESTAAEKAAVQKLVDEAKTLIAKVEKDLEDVKKAFADQKEIAEDNGATSEDFYSEELDTSSVEEYIAEAKDYIVAAEAYLKGEEPPAPEVTVSSVSAINDITVTEGETVTLPKKVTVTYSDGTTGEVAVTWNTTGVDFTKVGETTVEGKVEGTDKKASVKVIVKAKEEVITGLKVASVSATNDTITVKLAEAVKEVKASDFTVTQSINKGDATGVTVTKAVLAEDGVTVTLTVEPVKATDVAQSVVYTVNKVAAEAFVIEAVAKAELKVESVSVITKTGVDVAITATTEALTGVTIEVKDNEGNVVEVKPVDLVKGETVASFKFEKALTVDPTGVWTVGGIKVDLDLKGKLEDVYNAADQVKLLASLNALELTDVNADNIAFYQTELGKLKDTTKDSYVAIEDFTKEVAQAVVTEGNKLAAEAGNEATVVKAVNDAKTEVALLAALETFERVNAEWIAAYKTTIDGTLDAGKDTAKEIQALVDTVNDNQLNKIPEAGTSIVGKLNLSTNPSIIKEDLEKAKSLVTAYQIDDAEGETAKKDLLNAIDTQLAIVALLDAETPAQLSVAYNNLVKFDGAFELDKDAFIDANRAEYIKAFNASSGSNHPFNTITKITTEIATVNSTLTTSPLTNVVTKGAAITDVGALTETQTSDLLAALKAVPGLKNVSDDNKEFYAKINTVGSNTINDFGDLSLSGTPEAKLAQVQALVDAANLDAVKGATDADKLYKALVDYGNDVKDINVANKANYWAGSNANFSSVSSGNIQTAVDTANIKAVKAATTAAGVLAKLQIITQLKDVKAENAKAYLDSVKITDGTDLVLSTTENLGDSTVTSVVTAQPIITKINELEAEKVTLKALNSATTETAVRDALTEIALNNAISFGKYIDLKSEDKLIVAKVFLSDALVDAVKGSENARTEELTKYTTVSNITTDVETLIATKVTELISNVETAFAGKASVSNSAVQGLLVELEKYGYEGYKSATPSSKLAIAEKFISNYPKAEDGNYVAGQYPTLTSIINAVEAAK